jgi:8-oxo-dGTP pyrophosphatase MutT (NUDIX family)
MKKNNDYKMKTCNNCGKIGHVIKNCKEPITSFGLLLIQKNKEQENKYLMQKRKDSIAFLEIIRGKFQFNNIDYIQKLIDNCTIDERNKLINTKTEKLITILRPKDFPIVYDKVYKLKYGFLYDTQIYDIHYFIQHSSISLTDCEYSFPKGRKNQNESITHCAIRETYEETGLQNNIDYILTDNTVTEILLGINNKEYKYIYIIGHIINNNINLSFTCDETENLILETYDTLSKLLINQPTKLELLQKLEQHT